MHRPLIYTQEIPLDTDFLRLARATLISLGMALQAVLGTSTLIDGLACAPTAPASMQVSIGTGSITSLAAVDATAYGSLAADTAHQIVKQGIALDSQLLTLTAPSTSGYSQNYLVQASFLENDTTPVVLPYYNSATPSSPLLGPGGSGQAQNTIREGDVVVQLVPGVAAPTGSQTTPAATNGATPLYVITVQNGQTTITSANISTIAGAPFISEKLKDKISQVTGDARYALKNTAALPVTGAVRNLKGAWASNTTATWTADELLVTDGSGNAKKLTGFSGTINTAATVGSITGLDTGTLAASTLYGVYAIYNPTSDTKSIIFSASLTGPAALPSGYTMSALIGVFMTNGSSQVNGFTQRGKEWQYLTNLAAYPLITSGPSGSVTASGGLSAFNVSAYVPVAIVSKVRFQVYNNSSSPGTQTVLAPNNGFNSYTSSNPPPVILDSVGGPAMGQAAEFLLESTNIWYASNNTAGTCGVRCMGFTLNI